MYIGNMFLISLFSGHLFLWQKMNALYKPNMLDASSLHKVFLGVFLMYCRCII